MEKTNNDEPEDYEALEEKLHLLVRAYRKQYPKAASPQDNLHTFGPQRLIDMLEGAAGREIKFFNVGGGSTEIEFEYVQS